ncbi:hypothetical protein EYR41_006118 [Orbilia oligospora]|uniref:Uncharacterized protein n=1 Tax=Orbilia oligospora TaxID=2813651 RepID=A0A8H2E3J3_ORBOL|nr:hypothetical protein EYR41_006118 [Orbilia oligospora]
MHQEPYTTPILSTRIVIYMMMLRIYRCQRFTPFHNFNPSDIQTPFKFTSMDSIRTPSKSVRSGRRCFFTSQVIIDDKFCFEVTSTISGVSTSRIVSIFEDCSLCTSSDVAVWSFFQCARDDILDGRHRQIGREIRINGKYYLWEVEVDVMVRHTTKNCVTACDWKVSLEDLQEGQQFLQRNLGRRPRACFSFGPVPWENAPTPSVTTQSSEEKPPHLPKHLHAPDLADISKVGELSSSDSLPTLPLWENDRNQLTEVIRSEAKVCLPKAGSDKSVSRVNVSIRVPPANSDQRRPASRKANKRNYFKSTVGKTFDPIGYSLRKNSHRREY